MTDAAEYDENAVGPVLHATPLGWAVASAIQDGIDAVHVRDEGAYLRILGQGVCRVSKSQVEAQFGQEVRFPGDLEVIMSSFSGLVDMNESGAVWWKASGPRPDLPT